MKKIAIVILFLFNSFFGFPQLVNKDSLLKMTPTERACFLTNYEKKTLSLNEMQTKQTLAINLLFAPKLDIIIKSKANSISRYFKAKGLIEEREKEYKRVFSSAQFKKYLEIKNK